MYSLGPRLLLWRTSKHTLRASLADTVVPFDWRLFIVSVWQIDDSVFKRYLDCKDTKILRRRYG